MKYNPNDMEEGGGRATAGTYEFKIDDAVETTFRSGNDGAKVTLMVGAFATKDVKVFENFVYLPQALWRLKSLMEAVGLDFAANPDVEELINLTGKAKFRVGEKGYLEVEEFLPAKANNLKAKAPKGEYSYGPPPMQEATEDVPF